MSDELNNWYFEWLWNQVKRGYPHQRDLALKLFTTEFTWFVPNDDNRLEDGRELRLEFVHAQGIDDADENWLHHMGCSVFEMMLGLARRLAFLEEGKLRAWFWILVDNLGPVTDESLESLVQRTYESNGVGGLFPLKHPKYDQRKVEIWYQANAWLIENV